MRLIFQTSIQAYFAKPKTLDGGFEPALVDEGIPTCKGVQLQQQGHCLVHKVQPLFSFITVKLCSAAGPQVPVRGPRSGPGLVLAGTAATPRCCPASRAPPAASAGAHHNAPSSSTSLPAAAAAHGSRGQLGSAAGAAAAPSADHSRTAQRPSLLIIISSSSTKRSRSSSKQQQCGGRSSSSHVLPVLVCWTTCVQLWAHPVPAT